MRLSDYIEWRGRGTLSKVADDSGISIITVMKAAQGKPIGLYVTAQKISEATSGAVSIEELCNPKQPTKKKRKARAK